MRIVIAVIVLSSAVGLFVKAGLLVLDLLTEFCRNIVKHGTGEKEIRHPR